MTSIAFFSAKLKKQTENNYKKVRVVVFSTVIRKAKYFDMKNLSRFKSKNSALVYDIKIAAHNTLLQFVGKMFFQMGSIRSFAK